MLFDTFVTVLRSPFVLFLLSLLPRQWIILSVFIHSEASFSYMFEYPGHHYYEARKVLLKLRKTSDG